MGTYVTRSIPSMSDSTFYLRATLDSLAKKELEEQRRIDTEYEETHNLLSDLM